MIGPPQCWVIFKPRDLRPSNRIRPEIPDLAAISLLVLHVSGQIETSPKVYHERLLRNRRLSSKNAILFIFFLGFQKGVDVVPAVSATSHTYTAECRPVSAALVGGTCILGQQKPKRGPFARQTAHRKGGPVQPTGWQFRDVSGSGETKTHSQRQTADRRKWLQMVANGCKWLQMVDGLCDERHRDIG